MIIVRNSSKIPDKRAEMAWDEDRRASPRVRYMTRVYCYNRSHTFLEAELSWVGWRSWDARERVRMQHVKCIQLILTFLTNFRVVVKLELRVSLLFNVLGVWLYYCGHPNFCFLLLLNLNSFVGIRLLFNKYYYIFL